MEKDAFFVCWKTQNPTAWQKLEYRENDWFVVSMKYNVNVR